MKIEDFRKVINYLHKKGKTMKKTHILLCLLIVLVMVLTSCDGIMINISVDTDETTSAEETTKEEAGTKDTTEKTDVADLDQKQGYTVKTETTFEKENVVPVYDMMTDTLCSFGVYYVYDGENLVALCDNSGEVITNLSLSYAPDYCSICGCITNHDKIINPETFEIEAVATGHGGYSDNIFYTEEGGEFFTYDNGFYNKVSEIKCSVVTLATTREPTQDEIDYSGADIAFDFHQKHGISVGDKVVVPFEHDGFIDYKDGVCALRKNGKWGYFNAEGKQILPFEYDASPKAVVDMSDNFTDVPYQASWGYIALCKDGKWAYANLDGELVTEFEFEDARPAFDGTAWVRLDGKWVVIEFAENETKPLDAKAAEKAVRESFNSPYYESVNITDLNEIVSFYEASGYHFNVETVTDGEVYTYECICLLDGTVIQTN